jgi:hypothetical protein
MATTCRPRPARSHREGGLRASSSPPPPASGDNPAAVPSARPAPTRARSGASSVVSADRASNRRSTAASGQSGASVRAIRSGSAPSSMASSRPSSSDLLRSRQAVEIGVPDLARLRLVGLHQREGGRRDVLGRSAGAPSAWRMKARAKWRLPGAEISRQAGACRPPASPRQPAASASVRPATAPKGRAVLAQPDGGLPRRRTRIMWARRTP